MTDDAESRNEPDSRLDRGVAARILEDFLLALSEQEDCKVIADRLRAPFLQDARPTEQQLREALFGETEK